MHPVRWLVLLCVPLAFGAPVKFNRDIRPIMSDTCFRCHGPDRGSRMAGLRLDIREEALKATRPGVIPIVPGDPDGSAIIQRIFAANAKVMPPKYSHKELTAAQKDLIRRWVAEGAQYEGHWAYIPVSRPPVPEVAGARAPIDAFIRARLAAEGLQPWPEADRRTLIRRVSFDLTGLPPTPEQARAFINDTSADAYEKVVDRLLASPRYAENQAMHWLDAVRYGDSAGFHGDNLLPAWPYRDYVLRAWRDNKPFDQFTREQIAGDLMPHATVEQKVASAYNRMNRTSAEGGLQPAEYLAKYGADRVRTTSTVWMGATMGCSECHDHKFDPFTAKDFYSMKAFFADIKESGLVYDRGTAAFGSKLAMPTEEQAAGVAALARKIEATKAELEDKLPGMNGLEAEWEKRMLAQYQAGQLAWRVQRPVAASAKNGAKLTIAGDEPLDQNFYVNGSLVSERKPSPGLIMAGGTNPDTEVYTVKFKPGPGRWTALGIEVFQDEGLPGSRFARGADRFVLSEIEAEAGAEKTKPKVLGFVLANSERTGELPQNEATAAIDGDPGTGWAVSYGESFNPFLALRLAEPLTTTASTVVTVRLRQESEIRRATIGRFRVLLSAGEHSWPRVGSSGEKLKVKADDGLCTLTVDVDRGLPARILKALQTPVADRDEAQRKAIAQYFAWAMPGTQGLVGRIAKLELEKGVLEAGIPQVVLTEAAEPRMTRILPRGDFLNESGEVVEPAIPGFLGKLETGGRRATRLDLANWIASPSNPLTARVYVNRLWREFFGTGLSKVLEDLGSQGEWPTHPELLDWMAAEFMESGWDVKHMIRTIVTSEAYRLASFGGPPVLEERDPDNRLIGRQSRFRVEAENVHDIALAVSGLLVEKFGGPSVNPYQPAGYLTAMNFPKRDYSEGHGEDLYRRGLYSTWQRTFLHPSLATFDAPTREECTVNRVNSNTPLQALELLNDPIYVEAARVFAANMVEKGGKTLGERMDWGFERALDRNMSGQEKDILTKLYVSSLTRFRLDRVAAAKLIAVGESPAVPRIPPAELAAMTTVARAILNMHEVITRN